MTHFLAHARTLGPRLCLALLVACAPSADQPEGHTDSAESTLPWSPAPPTAPGTLVTFEADCELLAEPQTMRWMLLEEGWWELDVAGTEPGARVEWLPEQCRGNTSDPTKLWWSEEGDIRYADIHRATPDIQPGHWTGQAGVGELPLDPACRELLESHDALAPALSLRLEELREP